MKNQINNDADEPSGRKFQSLVYTLGVLLIGLTFFQFWYASETQTSIAYYDNQLNTAETLRSDLATLQYSLIEVATDFRAIDLEVGAKVSVAAMTEGEANMTILAARYAFYKPLPLIISTLMIWDENIVTSTGIGGFVVKPELEWLFTENIIWVFWLPYFYNRDALLDARFASWNNTEVNPSFNYQHTKTILTQYNYSYGYKGNIESSFNWYSMDVHPDEFDIYVEENMNAPKLNLERQLNFIEIGFTANTIGVLALGFLVDFGRIKIMWKYIYSILVGLNIAGSFLFTII